MIEHGNLSRQRRRRLLAVSVPTLVIFTAVLLFFHKLAFSNLILARGDALLYFYPYWESASRALRAGRIPLWNPQLFMGAPFAANSQVGFFYPLNWPLWLLLPVPYAFSASIITHLMIAGAGAYVAARRAMHLEQSAAMLAALAFTLGGYLTAQVEHVNQVQGLAWLPWILAAAASLPAGENAEAIKYGAARRPATLRTVVVLALLLGLQLLAGHAQTVFISLLGVGIWLIATWLGDRRRRRGNRAGVAVQGRRKWCAPAGTLLPLAAAGLLALLLAAVQLLPTIELARLSSRAGGLPLREALSFSLPPLLLSRSLLPAYGQVLFSEYVASMPLVVLLLAVAGAWTWRRNPVALPALALAACGLFLAFGLFNPLYWLLAQAPPFNLFRAPARWLVLYSLGVALLAGLGWQALFGSNDGTIVAADDDGSPATNRWLKPLGGGLLLLLALSLWSIASGLLESYLPLGSESPWQAPSPATLLGWAVEVGVLAAVWATGRLLKERSRGARGLMMVLLALAVMFLSSRHLSYNRPTAPQAYFELRPPAARLLAASNCGNPSPCPGAAAGGQVPPGRLLSMSEIFFDPGDQGEIAAIYADQLDEQALFDYTVATKQKEIVGPNLPLAQSLYSVDGFDGGLLPLQAYSDLVGLLLPDSVAAVDGRLREFLEELPEPKWLDLFNVQFVLTDKVGDAWRDGVFFDRQHPATVTGEEAIEVAFVPEFEATGLWLLAARPPAVAAVTTADGGDLTLPVEALDGELHAVTFPQPLAPVSLALSGCTDSGGQCQVSGLTLVDSRDGAFQPLVPGQYRLVHSGDVKIYENLDVWPRAFVVHEWQWVAQRQEALNRLQQPQFDGRRQAIMLAEGSGQPAPPGNTTATVDTVRFVSYEPEEIVLDVSNESPGIVVVTEAHYPGWRASVDGEPASIYEADGLFRGLYLPAGEHRVELIYRPRSFVAGALLTLAGLLLAAGGLLFSYRRRRDEVATELSGAGGPTR